MIGCVATRRRAHRLPQKRKLGGEPADLGRHFTVLRIAAHDGHVIDFQTQLPRPHCEVEEEVVNLELGAEWRDIGMRQIARRIGPEPVGRIGEPVLSRHAQKRCVDQAVCNRALKRGVLGLASGQVSRTLDIIAALFELGDELRDRLDPVLAIPVDGDDPVIAFAKSPGVGHAKLRRQLARPRLGQHRAHAHGLHEIGIERPIGGAAVRDDHIDAKLRFLDPR